MCLKCQSAGDLDDAAIEVVRPAVPLAGPVLEASEPGDASPGLPAPDPGSLPGPVPDPPIPVPLPQPPGIPLPPFPFVPCNLDLRDGCWAISVRLGTASLVGTLRVDRGTGHLIVSGDLYNDPPPVAHLDTPGAA